MIKLTTLQIEEQAYPNYRNIIFPLDSVNLNPPLVVFSYKR